MILCPNPTCARRVSARMAVCPDCGARLSRPDRAGGYALVDCVAETRTASIYRARRIGDTADVCLRLYDADVAIAPEQERALRERFAALRALPADRFVHTLDFGWDAALACWYRVTPWLPNVKAWGDFKCRALAGADDAKRDWIAVCLDLADSFRELHRLGRAIPDFTLDDCLLYRADDGALRVRLDATLASCLGPGSGREKARGRHPDFAAGRLLSIQSDVWTLGGLFVAMLVGAADVADPAQAMDAMLAQRRPLAVHPKLGRLLRQMVDPDPAERPRDMKAVCERLREFGPDDVAEWSRMEKGPLRQRQLLHRLWGGLATVAAAVAALAVLLYWNADRKSERRMKTAGELIEETRRQLGGVDVEHKAQAVFERHSPAVAFVLTEAWLDVDGTRTNLASSSGTAFLASEDGYLLSNRHVVAPWLSGETAKTVAEAVQFVRESGKPFRFGANHWLWFDGELAFRSPYSAPSNNVQLADMFRLDTAYASRGDSPRLRVVGVMPTPADPAEFLASTLEDDVAVLKVECVPPHARPIPLSTGEPPPRGAGLLVLGYARGRAAIPGNRAVARATRGSSSGAIWDVITTDADLQPGNSGGPVFDLDGYAVGIASALLSADGRMETSMGRILPIETARRFLDDMRTGRPAWDGLLESAFEPELLAARNAATQGDWETARALVETPGVLANPDAALKAAVFSMHEEGFTAEGRAALERVSAMAPHFPFAALLRHWDAWRRGVPPDERPCRQDLLQAAWWSPFEPYGQVARLLERPDGLEPLARGAETPMEWALYHWAAGTAAAKKGDRERAAELLQTGLRGCLDDDSHVRDLLAASLWFECGKRHRIAFDRDAPKRAMRFQDLDDASATLISGDWEKARKALERHFKTPRRESANTLGLGLMLGQAKGLAGDAEGERKSLQEFRREIRNPWYRTIADCLLGDADADATLATVAGKRPETLTLALALGLQAEGRGEIPRALDYYRAALDTGQINWLEYQIAQARRDALGKP